MERHNRAAVESNRSINGPISNANLLGNCNLLDLTSIPVIPSSRFKIQKARWAFDIVHMHYRFVLSSKARRLPFTRRRWWKIFESLVTINAIVSFSARSRLDRNEYCFTCFEQLAVIFVLNVTRVCEVHMKTKILRCVREYRFLTTCRSRENCRENLW